MLQKKCLLALVLLPLTALASCQEGKAQSEAPTPSPLVNQTAGNTPAKPYDLVYFGSYQQAGQSKTPIAWIVLAVEEGKTLLLSRDLLSSRPWDVSGQHLTYDKSSIRQWLNEDFLTTAFTPAERDSILLTELDNSDQHGYGTPTGEDTTDRVFLLSVNEFNTYLQGSSFNTATPTAQAQQEGVYANASGLSAWWLRSPGQTVDSPAYLFSGGRLGVNAHKATEHIIGIRPAIWIKNTPE